MVELARLCGVTGYSFCLCWELEWVGVGKKGERKTKMKERERKNDTRGYMMKGMEEVNEEEEDREKRRGDKKKDV